MTDLSAKLTRSIILSFCLFCRSLRLSECYSRPAELCGYFLDWSFSRLKICASFYFIIKLWLEKVCIVKTLPTRLWNWSVKVIA